MAELFICGTRSTSEGEKFPISRKLRMQIRAEGVLQKAGWWPPHLTFEDLEVQKAEGSCLWHKWNWSVPLNVFSGSCAPNHAGCRERMSWGADTAYSCFSFLAWWLWWAGLGCWTSLWHWKPVRVRVSSQWCQRSLASQKCQPFTLLLSDPS